MGFIDHFDKIYIIHCVENKKREENIKYQLKKLTCDLSKLNIHETCYFPFSKQAQLGLFFTNKTRNLQTASEYNLTREFYQIIKTSYFKGYEHILIFEDDFSLINQDLIDKYFNELPKDWDILQLSYQLNKHQYDYSKILNNPNYWIKKDFGAWSNNGLGLSRNGMKYWIDYIDKEFVAADIPTHESTNNIKYYGKINQSHLNHYIPNLPLVYIDGVDSTVQTDDKSDIYELYESLDKNLYTIYNENN